jgi:hypothetical protein
MNQSKPATPLYFVNAPVDFFFIGGASIATFIAISLFYTPVRTPEAISLAIFLMWIINWPHFSMSTHRLYHSRANIEQYPITAIVVPFVIVGAVALSFAYPTTVAPYFVKLFLVWSPYHFSGQTVGISLIYARRSGLRVGKWERMVLSSFVFGTFFLSTIRAETTRDGRQYYGVEYPGMGVPQWLATAAEWAMWAAFAAFVAVVIYWCYKNKRVIPAIVLLPAITQYVWFVQSIYTPSFQEFVPMFHSLQYILIAWGIQLREKMQLLNIAPSKRYVFMETTRWTGLNFLGGIGLFYVLPLIGISTGAPAPFAEGVIIAAVQVHHFFVDGVIWKLKNQTVSHPLMMNIEDLINARAPEPATEPAR